jgi:hypothetical protein
MSDNHWSPVHLFSTDAGMKSTIISLCMVGRRVSDKATSKLS